MAEATFKFGGLKGRMAAITVLASYEPAAEIVMNRMSGSLDHQCELWVGLDFKSMTLRRRKERGNG